MLKLCRSLGINRGHVLFMSSGGLGRTAITRLIAFINGLSMYQIEMTKIYKEFNWKDDLRKLMK